MTGSPSKKFDASVRHAIPEEHWTSLTSFEKIADVMRQQSCQRFLWAQVEEPRHSMNNYLDILWAMYVAKFDELYNGLIDSVNRSEFLLYGLIGRSLIEHAATIRYYFRQRLRPTVDEAVATGTVTAKQIQTIVKILDQFLRGSRFDWNAFFTGNYADVTSKSDKDSPIQKQVNTLTCIQKWSKEEPSVSVLYDLLCDLVHPNIGSTFLVMKTWNDGIGFGGVEGHKTGENMMLRTMAGLIGVFNDVQECLNGMLLLKIPIDD